jgi:hypothetical protein
MLRVDGRKGRKRVATCNELEGRIGAFGHARILHLIHAEAMREAVVPRRDTFDGGLLERLVFWRMHHAAVEQKRAQRAQQRAEKSMPPNKTRANASRHCMNGWLGYWPPSPSR